MNLTRLSYRLTVLPWVISCFICLALVNYAFPAPAPPSPAVTEDDRDAGYRRALELIKQGKNSEALPLLEAAWQQNPNNRRILADYLSTLVWLRQYDKAIKIYAAHRNLVKDVRYLYRNLGQAYYESRDWRQAQAFYLQAFAADHSDAEALKGVIFSSWKLTDYNTGFRAWLTAYQQKSVAPDTLRAMKLYMMQNMGASTLAWLYAREAGIKDKELMTALEADVAQERIKWNEYDVSLQILEQQLRDNLDNFRARCDYIVALKHKYRMREVLEQYRLLEQSGRPIPYWVTEMAADASLYLKQPRDAAKYYQLRLSQSSEAPFDPYLGLCSTYTELREWRNADQSWQQVLGLLREQKLNDQEAYDAVLARGWYFIYQDKLRESQDYFGNYLKQAGLDSGFRSGLGWAYYFRGWPRRALEQFRIAANVDPRFIPTQLGIATSLNDIGYKYEARKLASELYQKYPYDLHVIDLVETLRAEDMHQVWGDARFIREWPGVVEYRFRGGAVATITPTFNVFADILHMHSTENTNGQKFAFSWDRIGGGFNWRLLPPLVVTQSVSSDYLKGRDLGSFTKVTWQVNDHLRTAASFDSFSLDIPLRARATGVKGKTANFDLLYHESDLREYGMAFASNWLSDGNYNPGVVAWMDQNVINQPNWKLRLGPAFYYARYSKDPNVVPYYSPNFEYSIELRPTLQLIWYNMYDRKIRTNIYTHIGLYREWGFSFYPITGVNVEQEITLSKTFGMKVMAGYNLRVYDGKYTNVLDAFFTFFKKF